MNTENQKPTTEASDAALTASPGSMSALPVKAESMEHGKAYIWNKWDGRMSVVKLSTHGESLMGLDPPDEWYFEDELIGTLHGPILLSSNNPGDGR